MRSHDPISAICYKLLLKIASCELTYPEFPFESEAKGDNLIKQRQLKIERVLTILTRALSWAISGFGNTFTWEKEAKGLDNRYYVKFMQFGMSIGLYASLAVLLH